MSNLTIGRRIKALRIQKSLTQSKLGEVLGLKDHQSISTIENGTRALKAAELVKLTEFFEVRLQDLTNPFLLSDRESFSWRQHMVPLETLNGFEKRAGEWIGAFQELSRMLGRRPAAIMPRLPLTHDSAFEDAVALGEDAASQLNLGPTPAFELSKVLEAELGILVLMVDAVTGVSGAACRLPKLNTILINRQESAGRRSADMAHEFFHLLTWDNMKPERIEGDHANPADAPKNRKAARNQRIEQLADNFASGLLMPSDALDRLGDPPKADVAVWLDAAAAKLGVSATALKWRLVNSERAPHVADVSGLDLARFARERGALAPPPLFSQTFVDTLAAAIAAGHISAMRAATLVDLSILELAELCDAHQVDRPDTLSI